MNFKHSLIFVSILSSIVSTAFASSSPPSESNKNYSLPASSDIPSRVYWGDTHVHTGLSLDAGLFGNTVGLDEAYRFAKGEKITSSTGLPVRLARPLDWMIITDHTDLMGIADDIKNGSDNILAVDKGREYHEAFKKGGQEAGKAAFDLIQNFSQMTLPKEFVEDYSPGSDVFNGVWKDIVEAADKHNEPGLFTAFIGFEWTSVPKGFNLHRNVIFRDNAEKALQVVPATTQAPSGDTNPKSLYKWLEDYHSKTGGKAFAFAHNGNLSNGWMFPTTDTYHGGKVDKAYVAERAKWEPHYEITQIKGDGEAHPHLSPDDEFADYENWDVGNLDLSELKKPAMLKGEYGREALKQGLLLEQQLGVNPYKFGVGGATDTHTSLATADEDNFFGKSVSVEPSPDRIAHPFIENEMGAIEGYKIVSSGYTGVWASENTRAALYDAIERKETYATTGPRMIVRFFGGWNYSDDDVHGSNAPAIGYEKGVPMGGDLPANDGAKAPSFMVSAMKDPLSGNLDRVQVIKGWLDQDGKLHERIYDVAVSDDRDIDSDGRCKEPVGNTVDVKTATWSNSIGDTQLATVWTDPDFNPEESAFYYVRVIEIPTPRWVLYDKVRLGADVPKDAELFAQERAYSSPIWYTPQ
ncbi:DUF3604 domain-containing protein [Thalassotalea litorea]|uniref:DUF3604 domain-containing protein n=1 Tax=Thalassotalea litorea TaxID=2020715 RepID=UPI003735A6D9